MKPLCLYHFPCQDGFTAAWCVRHALGVDNVEFVSVSHGDPPPAVAGRDVVIVDFSYKRPVLEQMAESADSLLILDHHLSAQRDLDGLPKARANWSEQIAYMDAPGCPSFCALFDMNRSGAGIAWDYFHPCQPRPWFVDHVEDRDIWRFAIPHTREVAAALFSHPYDFAMWDEFANADDLVRESIINQGEAIERKHHKDIAELVGRNKRELVVRGERVWALNVPYTLVSDAGHALCELDPMRPFACCYFDSGAHREYSLRSLEAGADVSQIAKHYGGGGHKHAAGFRLPFATLNALGEPV